MWKIRKFSLQSGLELMTTRMINEVLTNWTTELAGCITLLQFFHHSGLNPTKNRQGETTYVLEYLGLGVCWPRHGCGPSRVDRSLSLALTSPTYHTLSYQQPTERASCSSNKFTGHVIHNMQSICPYLPHANSFLFIIFLVAYWKTFCVQNVKKNKPCANKTFL